MRAAVQAVLLLAMIAEPASGAVLNRSGETICIITEEDGHEIFVLPPDGDYFGRHDGFAFPHSPPAQRIFKTPGRWGLGCNVIIWRRDDIEVECDAGLDYKAGWRNDTWVKRRPAWRRLVECSNQAPGSGEFGSPAGGRRPENHSSTGATTGACRSSVTSTTSPC